MTRKVANQLIAAAKVCNTYVLRKFKATFICNVFCVDATVGKSGES